MVNEFIFLGIKEQLNLAKNVFEIAKRKSHFYKDKYKELSSIKDYKDWLKIPFLTRQEIYKNEFPHSKDMLTCDIEDMIVVSTGGSSGTARFIVFTHEEWDKFVEIQAKALKLLGITRKDIVANLFVSGNMWPSFLGGHDLIRKLGAVHLPISVISDMDRLMELLFMFKPTVILSLPTMFVFIADYLIEHKKRLDSVRMIQYVGEHLSENAKGHIKNAFGEIEIKPSGYSSSDCGLMGYQCEECKPNEYHIPTEAQLIEIYDFENDRLCKEEETGEIIVTNLTKTSFPIIRYRVGDIGYIKKERCKCGDKNPVLVLKGRAGEDFKLGGGYISMDEIDEILSDFVSVDGISANYSIEIEDMGNWLKLTIKIETSNVEASKKHVNEIKRSLNRIPLLKQDENEAYVKRIIEFVPLGSLERSPITGKIRKLVDKRVN